MARAATAKQIEAPPEADRLEEFPHPRHTKILYGHEAAQARLAENLTSARMHHAWLICGAKGIGKATLAYRIARYALADETGRSADGKSLEVSVDCLAARQVNALSHPGLLLMRRVYDHKTKRFSATIPVDEIRKLRSFLNHKADEGKWRVVIVDSADELNVSSANALLKSLEEPPPRAIFLLISSQPGRLLPTIRSRCRRLDLEPLESDPLRRAVLQALEAADMGREDADLGTLEPLAAGSVRQLLTLRAGGGLDLHGRCLGFLKGLPAMDWQNAHKLADEISSPAAVQRFDAFFELLFGLLSRAIRAGASGEGHPEDLEVARQLTGATDLTAGGSNRLASWAGLWETMLREKETAMALNLDRKALVLETLSAIERLARQQHTPY